MYTTTTQERKNFIDACEAVISAGLSAGWPQLALSIGAHPTQLNELREGKREDIIPGWINNLVKRFKVNPNFIYFSEGSPLLNFKKAA